MEQSPALLHRAQTFTIWIHSIAPDGTDPSLNAQAARQATDALLDQVLAAIRRTQGGRVYAWGPGSLLNGEARGDFVYGSIRSVNVVIPIPVFDDETPVGVIGEVEGRLADRRVRHRHAAQPGDDRHDRMKLGLGR